MSEIETVEVVEGEIVPEITYPHVVHKGIYTLWEKADGTLRVQYRRDDKDTEDFFEVPGLIIGMAKAAAEGKMNPADMIKAMYKIRNQQK